MVGEKNHHNHCDQLLQLFKNPAAALGHVHCLWPRGRQPARLLSLPMGFSRQEHWSRVPFPSPGDLPDPGIKPGSLESPALAGGFFTTSASWGALENYVDTE